MILDIDSLRFLYRGETMNLKYIIFDFGKVLGYPISGKWFSTPKFMSFLSNLNIDMNKVKDVISENKYLVKDDLPIKTLEEEYNMFISFYSNILDGLGLNKDMAKEIAFDKVYNNSEYLLYDDVKDVLNVLNKKYKLIMLTNNFPSIIDYLKNEDIYDLFDKVYVSSICETSKNEEKFFDMVINDYNIKENEALFIDDFEDNLNIGLRKKLNVIMLDRENKKESKYKKISSLVELEELL